MFRKSDENSSVQKRSRILSIDFWVMNQKLFPSQFLAESNVKPTPQGADDVARVIGNVNFNPPSFSSPSFSPPPFSSCGGE